MSKSLSKTNLCERLKYKLIELPLEKELSEIMATSLKSIDHRASNDLRKKTIFQSKSIKNLFNNINFTEMQNLDNTENNIKKVAFKHDLVEILQKNIKETYHSKNMSKISNHSRKNSMNSMNIKKHLYTQNNKNMTKNFTSLNCIKGMNTKFIPTSKSKRSVKSFEQEVLLQKKEIEQYLFKIQIFYESKFTSKQLIEWLFQYCKKQNLILQNFIMKSSLCRKNGKKVERVWQIQRNYDVLISKLQQKPTDRHLCIRRYVKLIQLRALNHFLEMLYADKNRVKMKEFQDQIGENIRKLCQKIRVSTDNQFVVQSNARNMQVVHFLQDLQTFQQQYGTLKCIKGINRLRFNMINKSNNFIEKEIDCVNRQIKNIIKESKAIVVVQ